MNVLELFDNWQNTEKFEAGTVIYSEDEPAGSLYVILSGEVELTFHGDSLGTETAGGLLGEMAIIEKTLRNCTATAITAVHLARIDMDQFKELVDRSSEFSFHAMATLANRLRAVDRFINRQFGQ
jgi:CRP-like cAMP-binding protein